ALVADRPAGRSSPQGVPAPDARTHAPDAGRARHAGRRSPCRLPRGRALARLARLHAGAAAAPGTVRRAVPPGNDEGHAMIQIFRPQPYQRGYFPPAGPAAPVIAAATTVLSTGLS